MAWENVVVTFGDFVSTELLVTNYYDYPSSSEDNLWNVGTNFKTQGVIPSLDDQYYEIFDNGIFKLEVKGSASNPPEFGFKAYYNGSIFSEPSMGGWGNYDYIGIWMGIDEENEIGMIGRCWHNAGWPYKYSTMYDIMQSQQTYLHNAYLAIKSILHLPQSGGAGSGYIGNSLISNKKMVGYNVPTSSAESTKTESVNEASETPVANKPKIGNGFARIKFLRSS